MPPSFSSTPCLNFPDRCNRTAITRGVIPLFDQRPWGANLGSERSLMSRFSYHSVDEKSKHQFTVCPGVLLSKKHCSNPLESSKCFATSGTLKAKRFCTCRCLSSWVPSLYLPRHGSFSRNAACRTRVLGSVKSVKIFQSWIFQSFDSFKTNFRKYLMASYTSTLYREYSSNVSSLWGRWQ